ncbi:MAG: primosomal protein N' [Algiphilus sp.]
MYLLPVAINRPMRTHLDYQIDPVQMARIRRGMRVRVPLGRREVLGIALDGARPAQAQDRHRYKPVHAVLDDAPLLGEELMDSLQWSADYYHHPIGEVIAAALPGALRQGAPRREEAPQWLYLSEEGAAMTEAAMRRAPAQAACIARLREGPAPWAEVDRRAARALIDKGLCRPGPAPDIDAPRPDTGSAIALTPEQQAVCDALPRAGFSVSLLQGVTGSGKTEIYLAQAAADLRAGKQVLLLVPEIGLTPQLLARARERLGGRVISYHSGMTDAARLAAWRRIDRGEALLVVGTRSAVWLPFTALGRVWVDEEHDASFKQQDGFRYSARDVAVVRARAFDAPVGLGSATPALESLHNARQQRYRHFRLEARAQNAPGAQVHVVDARGQRLRGGLTAELARAIQSHVAEGGQVLLFINRRGYAPALLCRDCGWSATCRACDARMTWHKQHGSLLCHHCGARQAVPTQCPSCGASELRPAGHGTERIEEALQAMLPQARIARADSDVMQRAGAWQALRDQVLRGDVDILVGTQMLAKGHDFPGISLVGIVSVDQALFSADIRATERMGQLVTQVAGRAGRGSRPGTVLLQTHVPDHPLLRRMLDTGYDSIGDALREERATNALPPAYPLALLRAESADATAATAFLEAAAGLLRAQGAEAIGPLPAPMMRRAGRTRAQLWVQNPSRAALQQALAASCAAIERLPEARRVRWGVDVDPADTL